MIERSLRALAYASVAVAAATVAWLLVELWRHVEDPYWVYQSVMDAVVEAGSPASDVDPQDPLLARRIIVVTASINERTAAQVIPRLQYLAAKDPKAPIDLFVTTTGGWRDSAFAIIDTMRFIPAPVNTWAIGGCYSAGTLLVAAGTGTRTATPNALLMVHANLDEGDPADRHAQEPRELAREVAFWRAVAHLPPDWKLDSGDSYYLDADEARRLGIVDAVRERPPA